MPHTRQRHFPPKPPGVAACNDGRVTRAPVAPPRLLKKIKIWETKNCFFIDNETHLAEIQANNAATNWTSARPYGCDESSNHSRTCANKKQLKTPLFFAQIKANALISAWPQRAHVRSTATRSHSTSQPCVHTRRRTPPRTPANVASAGAAAAGRGRAMCRGRRRRRRPRRRRYARFRTNWRRVRLARVVCVVRRACWGGV